MPANKCPIWSIYFSCCLLFIWKLVTKDEWLFIFTHLIPGCLFFITVLRMLSEVNLNFYFCSPLPQTALTWFLSPRRHKNLAKATKRPREVEISVSDTAPTKLSSTKASSQKSTNAFGNFKYPPSDQSHEIQANESTGLVLFPVKQKKCIYMSSYMVCFRQQIFANNSIWKLLHQNQEKMHLDWSGY